MLDSILVAIACGFAGLALQFWKENRDLKVELGAAFTLLDEYAEQVPKRDRHGRFAKKLQQQVDEYTDVFTTDPERAHQILEEQQQALLIEIAKESERGSE